MTKKSFQILQSYHTINITIVSYLDFESKIFYDRYNFETAFTSL